MKKLSDKESVWIALSDLFIDNEVSYEYIARRLAHYEIETLERVLYFEVAPICISNMLTPIPPIWSGFDEDCLICNIKIHLQNFHASRFYRFSMIFKVRFYKYFLNNEWLKVVAEIRLAQTKQLSHESISK